MKLNNGLPRLIHHVCTRLFCAYFSKKAIWSQNIYIWSLLSLTFWWQITEHAKLLSSQKNDIVTKISGSAACHNKSQMRETGSCAKGRGIQVPQAGRIVDSPLKDHHPFLLKPMVLMGVGRGRFYFCPFVLLVFGAFRPCPFICLVLGALNIRTSPCAILANEGAPLVLLDYLW